MFKGTAGVMMESSSAASSPPSLPEQQNWGNSALPPLYPCVSVFPPVRWTSLGVKDRKVSEVPAREVPRISSWLSLFFFFFCISDGGMVRFQDVVPENRDWGMPLGTSLF